MKLLIAYATRNGSTRRCAEALASLLPGAECIDLQELQPDPSGYGAVILGGCVRMGQLCRPARNYLKKYASALLELPFAFFLCCGFPQNFETYCNALLTPSLREHALALGCFGGELNPDSLRGMDRLITNAVRRSTDSADSAPPQLDFPAIERFAEILRSSFAL
jgi:menaquinone-dependent protoporphyrinogen oxidase